MSHRLRPRHHRYEHAASFESTSHRGGGRGRPRPLASACRDLVAWYDELIAGKRPAIARLDGVITTLQALPSVGGRIGRDIDLIVVGGVHHTHDEIIGAVERLRTLANHQPTSPTTESPQSTARRRLPRGRTPSQAPLPGFGLTGQGGPE